jgi:uncharacterized protein (TIGR01777 family)
MKVLVTGASGFIGKHLCARLRAGGHTVATVGRSSADYDWSDASLARGVNACDAVVHLAGENLVAKRWSAAQKQRLWSSRHDLTTKLARLVAQRKPACFVSASGVGYYGASATATFDESSPRGQGFLAELCADWEAAANIAAEAGVRTAIVRTGVVLGKDGGALAKMLPPFKLGVGGPLGDGEQWMSWIHVDDETRLYTFLLENPKAAGAFNGTAPNPVTMNELAKALGKALHRPVVFRVPGPMLKLALGEVADVLLEGQRVLPRRALEAGFEFEHPRLEDALAELFAGKQTLAGERSR